MRRPTFRLSIALVSMVVLASCGQKTAQQAQQTTSADSLLASNPAEQTNGNLTPQTDYQQPATTTPAPATTPLPASKPKPAPARKPAATTPAAPAEEPGVTVPMGTAVKVAFTTRLTSETANPGDPWTGTVKDAIVLGSAASIPAGSVVHGVVTGSLPAAKGDRAVLVLRMTSIDIGGNSFEVSGHTDSLIAGSTRARNVGAVAGGTAAGALLGRAIGGSGKGALVGALIGAAGTSAAVAKSKGYQVEMKEGAELTFTTTKDARIRN